MIAGLLFYTDCLYVELRKDFFVTPDGRRKV